MNPPSPKIDEPNKKEAGYWVCRASNGPIYSQKSLAHTQENAAMERTVKAGMQMRGRSGVNHLGRFLDISFCDWSRSPKPTKRYLVKTEDCQSPQDCISRIDAPHWYKNVAPPLRRLCPENFSGENPDFAKRVFNFLVNTP